MSSPLPFNENSHALKMIQKKHFFQIKCLLITFLLFSAFRDFGQTVQTFTSSGSWICPSGVTSVTVECWGGGGAGGGIQTNGNVKASGGAGGAYAQKVIAVSSGTSYTYTVGLGGIGGTGNGPAGGNSWFGSTSTVLAVGGQGGGSDNTGNPGLGTTTGSIGTTVYKGGDGASGNPDQGAGGGGAGSSGNGGSAMTTSPYSGGTGTAAGGGNGGDGLTSNGDGLPGTSAGGGGSGARNTGNTNRNGGSGANGQIVITYYVSPTITNLSANICAGGSITITGANFVGITASNTKIGVTPVTSITSFTSTQIVAVVGSACSGTVIVTTPGGTATSAGTFTCYSIPSVSATTTYTCVGGSSGTITASGSGGSTPYTYSLNGGSYQTSNLFTGLAANTYTLTIKSNSGCISSASVTVNPYPTSTDNQNLTGADSWVSHAYDGTNFSNYIGHFTEAETFNEGFGGDYNCFSVTSNASTSTIYTETFSVKFRMNSTRKGLYVVDLGSDDGSRLTVDGNLVYNNWSDQSFSTKPRVLMNLTGSSSLLYEFYENAISNQVVFQNLTLVLANTLSANTSQQICLGSGGVSISGDTYGTLPSGISLSGTGYQWTYSTSPGGTRTNITGATGATFTPSTLVAPFNTAGTYYIYRNAILTSSNNINVAGYTATNESNAATIIVNSRPTGALSGSTTICNSGSAILSIAATGSGTITGTLSNGTAFSGTAPTITVSVSPSSTTTYTIATLTNGTCTAIAADKTGSATVTVNARPTGALSGSTTICNGSSATLSIAATGSGTITGTLSNGTAFSGTAPTITVSVSPSSTTTYTIATLTNSTCTAIAADKTGSATVNVTTAPSATISYSSPFCSNIGSATVTMTGTTGGTFSSPAIINPSTGTVDLAATSPGVYTVTYTIPASGGCAVYMATTSIIINPNTWTGGISTDWNTPGNWAADAVPTLSCPDVTIQSGVPYQPILNSGTFAIQNLYINSGAFLTINNATLQIAGSINNSGTFDVSNGTIEMNGPLLQTIPANAFLNNALSNLIISNTSSNGVRLGGFLDVYNSVTYSGTGMKLATRGNLTLKSTATNTAWLGDMTGNTITGKVTVERYISSRKAWRFLSVPANTTQTIQEAWQEGATSTTSDPVPGYGIQLSGAGGTAAGFDLYSATPAIKTYNSSTNTWVGVANTNATVITSADGYMTFIRGDRTANSISSPVTSTTLRVKGNLYTGNQTPIVVPAGTFTSMGNPYASAIDMRNITKTAGVKDFFYIWDPALAGNYGYGAYQTFSNNGSGNYVITPGGGSYGASGSISNYIQSGLAFFVQGAIGGGSLTFKEAAKTTGSAVASFAEGLPKPQLQVNLFGFNADNSTYMADGLLINYDDGYSNNVDDMDAIKIGNTSENLSTKTNNTLLVVERKHTISISDTIFLNLTGVSARNYRLEFTASQLYQPGLTGFLIDNYLHTAAPLNIEGITDIDFTVTSVAASKASNRFMIVFSQLGTLPVTFTSVKAYKQDNNVNVEWKVDNELNIKQYETEKSTDGNVFKNLAISAPKINGSQSASYLVTDTHPLEGYNYYRIKSTDEDGKTAYTNVVKVLIGSSKHDITVYPNPVVNDVIRLQLNNQPQGKYGIRLLNKAGQVLMIKQAEHAGGSSIEIIQLDKYLPHGIYQLEITKPEGSILVIKIVRL